MCCDKCDPRRPLVIDQTSDPVIVGGVGFLFKDYNVIYCFPYKMVRIEKGPASTRAKVPLLPSECGSKLNMASNIKVAVRVRPLNNRELGDNCRIVVDVVDEKMLVFDPEEEIGPLYNQGVQQPNMYFLKRANKDLKFVFDDVCGQNATNRDVFEATTKDMLASLMEPNLT